MLASVESWTAANQAHLSQRAPVNVGQFVPRKTVRAVRAVLPSWMLAVFTACLAIPGPFDEGAAVLVAVVLLTVRWRRAASAWRGGKTHRTA
jgi:hypothetical protein